METEWPASAKCGDIADFKALICRISEPLGLIETVTGLPISEQGTKVSGQVTYFTLSGISERDWKKAAEAPTHS